MQYIARYPSPLGGITMASDGQSLTGLWFDGQKYFGDTLKPGAKEKSLPVFDRTREWLDVYFSGGEPQFTPPLSYSASPFRSEVWQILLKIPYGKTTTYGHIAKELEKRHGKAVSAQAVGGAVGHNPISIVIPCHRVIGTNGSYTGYAGGIDKKIQLLSLEGSDFTGPLFRLNI